MNRYVFPGFPVFLARAAEQLGVDAIATAAKPPAAIASLANLCAQAATAAEDAHAAAILKEATVHIDRLVVAAKAAQMMLDEVGAARGSIPARPTPEAPRPRRPRSSRLA